MFSILFLPFKKNFAQQAPPIMERGLYVDDFLRFNSSAELMPESSILGVDAQQDGIFEKEDELLEYARDNHFTILTLYETEPAFSNTTYYAWNAHTGRMETMQEHLCRFISKAKSDYCIKEIYAAVGSSGEGQTIAEYNEQFKIATPAFELSLEELTYASTRLKILVGSYPEAHPMHYASEIAKFALRVAHFQSCNNTISKFDGVTSEYEFWNNHNYTGFEELMTDLDDIKYSFLSATIGRHFYINVYYGKNGVSQSSTSEIAFLDGTISSKRIADRIFFESYSQSPFSTNSGLPTRKENYFGEDISIPPTTGELETKANTQISTIFAAEARRNGSTNDFQGKWMENYGTGDQVNNIFECEKQNFLNWISAGNTKKGDNQMYPGAYQWFSSSYLLKSFKNQPLFYIEYPNACTSQPNYKIMYKGPTESGLNLHFVLTGPVALTLNTNSPDIAITPDLFFINQVLPSGNYTATLTIANTCGSGGKSYSESFVVPATTSPQIAAIGYQGSTINVCDGEKIILKAPLDYVYQWTKNGVDLLDDDATKQFYPVTEAGIYNCKLSCSGVPVNPVNDIDVRMKYNPYVSITAVPAGGSNYNLIAEIANVRNGIGLINCPGMLRYEWTTGETMNMITVNRNTPKKYSVTVWNVDPSNSCRSSNSIYVSGSSQGHSPFKLTPSANNCSGSAGTTKLKIEVIDAVNDPAWNSGTDITKGVISDGASTKYITWYSNPEITVDGLDPGRYVATATVNGTALAAATASTPFLPTTFNVGSPFSPSSIVGIPTVSPATCKGTATGSVSITLNGIGDYTVTLIGSSKKQTVTLSGSNLPVNFTGLPAGHYGLKIHNDCNFEYLDNLIVADAVGLTVTPTISPVQCYTPGWTGTISLAVSGGTTPYTYSWHNGGSTNSITEIPGSYTCTITSNSCSEEFKYKISQGSEIHLTTTCAEDGNTHLLIFGGNGNYDQTSLSPFQPVIGSPGEYSAPPGNYTLTATDDQGCASNATSIAIPASAVSIAQAGDDQVVCGNPDMNVFLEANTPVLGTGAWSIILGNGGVISRPNSPTSLFTGIIGESYLLRWTITGAAGCSSYDNVKITFHESTHPTPASAGPDQVICGTQAILAGNIPVVGTGKWTIIDGVGQLDYPEAPNAIFTGSSDNQNVYSYTLRWTIMNGDCPSSDEILITSCRAANAAQAGPDQTIACGTNPVQTTLQALSSGNHDGLWSIISGVNGGFSSNINKNATFTGVAGETYLLRWTLTRNNSPTPQIACTSSDDVVIKFSPVIDVNAGPDQVLCNENTALLNATKPAISGEGTWTVFSGTGGGFTNANDPYTTFTGIAGNNYVLRWTIIPTGGCGTTVFDDVQIKFPTNAVTASNAGADQKLCGLTTNLDANLPSLTETGTWTIISGIGGNIVNSADNLSSFSGQNGETYHLEWKISDGGCESTDELIISILANPNLAPNAGPDQLSLCGSISANLAGNSQGSYTGKWTVMSGGQGSFLNDSDPNTTFTGTAGNSYTLQWTISNSWCSLNDDVEISFPQNPTTALAGSDQPTCNTSIVLDANNAWVGVGTWSVFSGPNTNSNQFNNENYSKATFTPTSVGVYVLRWTISNSPCTASSDDVSITFNPRPTIANAGPDQLNVCVTTSTGNVVLAANTPNNGTGVWSVYNGVSGGSFTLNSDPTTTFTGAVGPTYVLQWTISNGLCTASSDLVSVSFKNNVIANAGADQVVCTSGSTGLYGNSPGNSTGAWSLVSGSGTITNPNSQNATLSNFGTGPNVFKWEITNPNCGTNSDLVTINGFAPPSGPSNSAGPDQAICINSVTLTALQPTTGTGAWSKISGSGTILSPNTLSTSVTGLSRGENKFKWRVNNGPCNALTDEVIITVDEPANAGPDQTNLCNVTSTTLAANTPVSGIGTWSIVSSTGGVGSFLDTHRPDATFSSDITGVTYTLRWTTPSLTCTNTDDVVITFNNDNITISNAGPDQFVCGSTSATLAANQASGFGETGTWYVMNGSGGSFSSIHNEQATFTGVIGESYRLRWEISKTPCANSFDDVIIAFTDNSNPLPMNSTISGGTYYVGSSFSLASVSGNTMSISGNCKINFAQGVHITVPTGETLIINNSTLKSCGGNMWGGIVVETGGTLKIDQNSVIEDAEIGADFADGSHCQISNTIFNKCFISARLQGNVDDSKYFRNVKFYCSDFVGQPTKLLSPHNGERAAGISLINSSLRITGNDITEFKNLRSAINSFNTSEVALSISKCSFNDLEDPDHLILTRGIEMSRGALSVSESNFTNCDVAVYSIDCGVNVVHSNFDNLNTAISASHPLNRSVNISYNNINCKRSGVDLLLMEGAYRAQVLSNSIVVGDPSHPTLFNSYGIQYSSSSTTYNNSRIGGSLSYNNITLLSKGEAIGMNFKTGMTVSNNFIALQNSSVSDNQIGVKSLNNKKVAASCNYISGDDASSGGKQTAMDITAGKPVDPRVSCNTFFNAHEGLVLMGNQGQATLRHNHFDSDYSGLHLKGSTFVGPQFHLGNYWTGTYANDLAAKNETFAAIPNQNERIFVNANPGDIYFPLAGTPNWFVYDSNDDEDDCSFPVTIGGNTYQLDECSSILPVISEAARTRPTDVPIIRDLLPLSDFREEIRYMAMDEIFARIDEFPELRDNNLTYGEFYDSIVNNSNIERFGEVVSTEVNWDGATESLVQNIESKDNLISWHLAQIAYNDSVGDSTHLALNSIHMQDIETFGQESEVLKQLLETGEYPRILQARLVNEDIEINNLIEDNLRTMNDVRLNALERESFEFTSDEMDLISQIAHQCPLAGGDGVSIARALYALNHPNEYYNDKSACLFAGYFRKARPKGDDKMASSALSYFTVNPNPASENLQLSYFATGTTNLELTIYNSLEQKVKSVTLPYDSREYRLNCSNLQNGVYMYSVRLNSESVYQGKICIINE